MMGDFNLTPAQLQGADWLQQFDLVIVKPSINSTLKHSKDRLIDYIYAPEI